jgi:hypothetical protein
MIPTSHWVCVWRRTHAPAADLHEALIAAKRQTSCADTGSESIGPVPRSGHVLVASSRILASAKSAVSQSASKVR